MERQFGKAPDGLWARAPEPTSTRAPALSLVPSPDAPADPWFDRPAPVAPVALVRLPRHREAATPRFELACDLSRAVGSAAWLRGFATLIGLVALAIAGFPGFQPVLAAPAMPIDAPARAEFRATMIMPLGLGADSGRHQGIIPLATPLARPLASVPERAEIDLVATLSAGDGFERMLRRAGVGEGDAATVSRLVAGVIPLAKLEPGTQADITLGRRTTPDAARPLDELSLRARFDLQLGVERVGGALRLIAHPIHVDATPLRVRGRVGESLYRSARAAGAPPAAVQEYLRTLSDDFSGGIAPDDEFDLVLDYKRATTGETEPGPLLYAAILRGGKPQHQMLRWGAEGRFYDPVGVGETRAGLIAPVPGPVISRFGLRRHPILGYVRMHSGLDFRAAYGTPIQATSDGTVQIAGRHGGYGNYVRLAHAGGLATGYAHMSRIAVSPGMQVRRGQVIGYVGSTGLSTGPHLHYEMYRAGSKIDPASVSFVTRAMLTGSDLTGFRARLASLLALQPGAALAVPAGPVPAAAPLREIARLAAQPAPPKT